LISGISPFNAFSENETEVLKALELDDSLAKFPEKRHTNLYTLVKAVGTIERKLIETYGKAMDQIVRLPISDFFKSKLPRTAARFVERKEAYFKSSVTAAALYFFKEFKEELLSSCKHNDTLFNVKLERYIESYISGDTCVRWFDHYEVEQFLYPKLGFYSFFLNCSDSVEYEQGEEGQDSISGQGICGGKSFDVNAQLLKDPLKKLSELSVDTVNSHHRFLQASFIINNRFTRKFGMHPHVKKKLGVVQEQIGNIDGIEGVENCIRYLRTLYEVLQASNPALTIYIASPSDGGSHPIVIRFDKKNDRYIFFDTNHGGFESKLGTPWLEEIIRLVAKYDWPEATHFWVEHLTHREH